MNPKLTTREAAKAVGIHQVTLQRWIAQGKVRAPRPILRNGVGMRPWSNRDIASLRKTKAAIYRKGRGRKKKKA